MSGRPTWGYYEVGCAGLNRSMAAGRLKRRRTQSLVICRTLATAGGGSIVTVRERE
ncbi:MAG: hypothetical protein JNK85_06745 [Verrucomicrobiales bacterium]|nr:hypothetical protein [Verrucomicrobiales bacterium]